MRGSWRAVGRDLGRVLQAMATMVVVSLWVPVVFGEWYAIPGLVVAGVVPLAVGRELARRFEDAPEPGKLHGMMIAAGGWFLVALFGALPFLLVAWTIAEAPAWMGAPALAPTMRVFLDPLNGVFESMSAFTGTGFTAAPRASRFPRTLQWWRSLSQWVGSLGVIVLTTAILARPGSGSMTLYESEARSERIQPSIVNTVRTIWWIFVLFTLVGVLLLWAAGMPTWDALNHALTAISTGGMTITDGSIGSYTSLAVQASVLPIMVLGAVAFPVHFLALRSEPGAYRRDLQARWVAGILATGVVGFTGALVLLEVVPMVPGGLMKGVFQWTSAVTTTGFQTAPGLASWPVLAQILLVPVMVVGASAGSTVGGLKVIRLATLYHGARHRIQGLFQPSSAVRHLRMGDRVLSHDEAASEFEEAAIVGFLWIGFLLVGLVVALVTLPVDAPGGPTFANVVFEVASAQGNIGLSTGIAGADLPAVLKGTFMLHMLMGRLEIIPVLVFLRTLVGGGGRG